MNGALAQAASLAAHASDWLARGAASPPPALDESASTFRNVGELRFEARRELGAPPAQHVADWLAGAAERGARRVWLVADTTGQRALLVDDERGARGSGEAELWRAVWELIPGAQGERVWRVVYAGRAVGRARPPRPPVEQARAGLLTALRAADDFAASRADLEHWSAWFRAAIDVATTRTPPEPAWFPDLLPPRGYRAPSRRLAAAATAAWVFGGHGSWNDAAPGGLTAQRKHRVVSERLFDAVLTALVAATNADLG